LIKTIKQFTPVFWSVLVLGGVFFVLFVFGLTRKSSLTPSLFIEVSVPSQRFMVFNATFNNISDISWRSDLLAEETGRSGENHRPVASH
jgi:hypothetical protein